MTTLQFNRDAIANFYALEHLKTDPGIEKVIFFPKGAGEREIRFVEVNKLIVDEPGMRRQLVPVDFGVDMGKGSEHKLWVIDVTPQQWEQIKNKKLDLPSGWELDEAVEWP